MCVKNSIKNNRLQKQKSSIGLLKNPIKNNRLKRQKFLVPVLAIFFLSACGSQTPEFSNAIIPLSPVSDSDDAIIEEETIPMSSAEIEGATPADDTENDVPMSSADTTDDNTPTDDTASSQPAAVTAQSEPGASSELSQDTAPSQPDSDTAQSEQSNDTAASEPDASSVQTSTQYTAGGCPIWNYTYLSGEYLGRCRVPAAGIDVACFNTCSQGVVDADDSALFVMMGRPAEAYGYTAYIADHNYQGFEAIKEIEIGEYMFFDCKDGNTYAYVCDIIDQNGYNTGNDGLRDHNGNEVYIGGIWMYTCNDTWRHITMLHFSAL